MSKELYVGNLPYDTNEDELKAIFSEFGAVTNLKLIRDKFTEQMKGFGFVAFNEAAEAQAAQESLNGKDFKGRPMRINPARGKPEGGGQGQRQKRY